MINLIVLEAIVMLLLTGLAVWKLIDNIKPLYAVITTAIVGVFWTVGGAFVILGSLYHRELPFQRSELASVWAEDW